MRGALPILSGKKHSYLQRQRDSERTLNEQDLLFPPGYLAFSPITFLHDSSLFIKPSTRTLRFKQVFSLHFLKKVPVSCKTSIKYISIHFLVNLSFVNRGPGWTFGWVEEKDIFPPLQFQDKYSSRKCFGYGWNWGPIFCQTRN